MEPRSENVDLSIRPKKRGVFRQPDPRLKIGLTLTFSSPFFGNIYIYVYFSGFKQIFGPEEQAPTDFSSLINCLTSGNCFCYLLEESLSNPDDL